MCNTRQKKRHWKRKMEVIQCVFSLFWCVKETDEWKCLKNLLLKYAIFSFSADMKEMYVECRCVFCKTRAIKLFKKKASKASKKVAFCKEFRMWKINDEKCVIRAKSSDLKLRMRKKGGEGEPKTWETSFHGAFWTFLIVSLTST